MSFSYQYAALVCLALYLARWLLIRSRSQSTPLLGPPSASLLWGQSRYLSNAEDPGQVYEDWAAKYGPAFKVPAVFGNHRVMICDPRAISHFYSKETFVYIGTPLSKRFIGNIFGKGLLWAEGESHRRQRKALTPGFSNAAIRRLTTVFFDSTYKLKTHWDSMIEGQADGSCVIDVQNWMNHVALDSIGIAGFSHDFGSLDGKPSAVVDAFESLSTGRGGNPAGSVLFALSVVFPALTNIPTERRKKMQQLRRSMGEIADVLLERNRKGGAEEEKSIIGLLIKAESTNGELHMTEEEVLAQMNVLLLAGYETTSISLTWALIELSRQPALQSRLRKELQDFGDSDPTWDQLMGSDFPFLDAVVHETLRLHPPLTETNRVATEDDILPLLTPLPTGETSIAIAKGTTVSAPIICINRAESIWGPNAKEFYPERWLQADSDADQDSGKEGLKVEWGKPGKEATFKAVQGHRHLLTFSDGPRTCLGKSFALAEFKAALSVLIRNYTFEFPEGPETKIVLHRAILPRPKVEGCASAQVPLRVRRVE